MGSELRLGPNFCLFCPPPGKPKRKPKRRKGEARSKARDFWKDNVILGGAAVIAGLINYCYHVVLAHLLGPTEYGSLATLLNVTQVMVLPASVATLVYTRFGTRPARKRVESVALWTIGVMLWGSMLVFRRPLGHMLRIDAGLLILFTLELIPSLAIGANTGILQHIRRYWAVSLIVVLSNGFRVFAAVATLLSHYRLVALGAFEALAAGMTWVVSRWLTTQVVATGDESSSGWMVGTALVGAANVVMGVADGMISKHNLSPFWAGEFNGLATIGHTVQYLSGSLGTVMLTSILANPKSQRKFALITLCIYLGLSGTAEGLFIQFGGGVIAVILGKHFLPMLPYLGQYGWSMMTLGLVNITLMHAVATKRWLPMAMAGLGIVVWIWALFMDASVKELVQSTEMVMGATAGIATITEGIMESFGSTSAQSR